MTEYELKQQIEKIVEANCIEHPYEGTEVTKGELVMDIMELIQRLIQNDTNIIH